LGSHHWKWPVGGVFIAPNTNLAVGGKLLLSAVTPDSLVVYRTVRWCTGQRTVPCPVRLAVTLSEQVTVGATGFHIGQSGQSDGLPSECHLELAVEAEVPGAPNSLACGHRTVRCSSHRQSAGNTHLHSWTSLGSS
jgi:hypothetical protein